MVFSYKIACLAFSTMMATFYLKNCPSYVSIKNNQRKGIQYKDFQGAHQKLVLEEED